MTVTTQVDDETPTTETLYFTYDASGNPLSVRFNNVVYYYVTNLQGDVAAIVNSAGVSVVEYSYDAWGNILSATGTMASTLGETNPLRYRGYYYDAETQLYYLQSRYYDPEIGRFINADSVTSTGQGLLGNNMFAYCRNNPVRRIDISGTADEDCIDNNHEDEYTLKARQGAGNTSSDGNNGPAYGSNNFSGYGQAPKQGDPGSIYTQYSSDGKNTVVSQTTYNEYGVPGYRVDYQGRDHNIGLPHVHEYSWGIRDGRVVPTGRDKVYLYRMQ